MKEKELQVELKLQDEETKTDVTDVINKRGVSIHIDETTGHRFSYNEETGDTKWLTGEEEEEKIVEENIDNRPEQLESNLKSTDVIHIEVDERSGHRFSFNETTGESIWLDAEEDAEEVVEEVVETKKDVIIQSKRTTLHVDEKTGHRYSYNEDTGEAIWLVGEDEIEEEH